MQNDERQFSVLLPEEQQKLRLISSAEDLTDVKFLRIWMDDGLPCVAISINKIEMAFWWLDTEAAGALMNPSRHESQVALYKLLRQVRTKAGELDDEDEFESRDAYDDDSYDDDSYDYGDY